MYIQGDMMRDNPYTKRFRNQLSKDEWYKVLDTALRVKTRDPNKRLHLQNFARLFLGLAMTQTLVKEVFGDWATHLKLILGLKAIIEEWLKEEESLLPDNQSVCIFMVSLWQDLAVLQFIFEQQEQTTTFADVAGCVETPRTLLERFPSLFPEC